MSSWLRDEKWQASDNNIHPDCYKESLKLFLAVILTLRLTPPAMTQCFLAMNLAVRIGTMQSLKVFTIACTYHNQAIWQVKWHRQCLDWVEDCWADLLTCVWWFQTTMGPVYKLTTIHGSVGCKSTLFTRSKRAVSFFLMSKCSGCRAREAGNNEYAFSSFPNDNNTQGNILLRLLAVFQVLWRGAWPLIRP